MSNIWIGKTMAPSLALVAATLGGQVQAAGPADTARIAREIRADVAQAVAGINAHDAVRATAFDAPDVVVVATRQPNVTGIAADRAGFRKGFASDRAWRVAMISESVDVAAAGDMAVYRSVYRQAGTHAHAPVSQRVNFIAGFRRQPDSSWKMAWYVVSDIDRPHGK
jgi:ketosteroid isomerase-like protein